MGEKSRHSNTLFNLGILALYLICTLALTYPLVSHTRDGAYNTGDPLLNTWIISWDVHQLLRAPTRLFDANIFHPASNTLAYSEHLLGIAVLVWPILLLSNNPILAYNIFFLFSFVVSGFTMYLLVAYLTGNKWAGVLSGFIFAFGPYRLAHVGHLQLLATQWMPLVFLYFERFAERRRLKDLLLLILFFNLQVFSCWYYALFLSLALGFLFVVSFLLIRSLRTRRAILLLGLFCLVSGVLSYPFARPYFEVAREMNFARSFQEVSRGSAQLLDYLSVPPDNRLLGDMTAAWRSRDWSEHSLFPGIIALLLSIIGGCYAVFGKQRSKSRFPLRYLALFLLAFVLSFGVSGRAFGRKWPLPYRLIYEYVPGFHGVRVPARFAVIVMLAVSVLAGYGFASGFRKLKQASHSIKRLVQALSVLVLVGGMGAEYISTPIPVISMPYGEEIPEVYRWLQERQENAVVVELPLPPSLSGAGYLEGPRLYYSTYHWHRLINGYSGFFPPTYLNLMGITSDFPNPESLAWLEVLETDYVLLHADQYPAEERGSIRERLASYPDRLQPMGEFEDVMVYELSNPGLRSSQACFLAEGELCLRRYSVAGWETKPGEVFPVALAWQQEGAPLREDYTVFTHLVDSEGCLWTQHDGQPQGGDWPTSEWPAGETVVDAHTMTIPEDIPPGAYELRVGFYLLSTMERLPVFIEGACTADDYMVLGQVEVVE